MPSGCKTRNCRASTHIPVTITCCQGCLTSSPDALLGKTPPVSRGVGQDWSHRFLSSDSPGRKELCSSRLGKRELWVEDGVGPASYTASWEGGQALRRGAEL